MYSEFLPYFQRYNTQIAPFMHQQLAEWSISKPLAGLKVLHHIPFVTNTLLKIACLVAAGAEVVVSNTSDIVQAHDDAIKCVRAAGLRYVESLNGLNGMDFDLYFDCGGTCYQTLGRSKIGAIELTGSGDDYYRQQDLDFPVISIDRTLTKQLETVFGSAQSVHQAIQLATGTNPSQKSWLVFGFGKIGRGIAYFCKEYGAEIVVVDPDPIQRQCAHALGIQALNPLNHASIQEAVTNADIIITATGKADILSVYPHVWFANKLLANMGVYDEFGPQFSIDEVLNHKKPVNFLLPDPTPISFIDPEFYIHNLVALQFLDKTLDPGVHGPGEGLDRAIISQWCGLHGVAEELIKKWFFIN